jgi:hypothetical protein
MSSYLRIGEDNNVLLENCANEYTGAYLNAATVSAQLRTSSGTPIGSSVTMTYQTGTNGHYLGVIDRAVTATLTDGTLYYVDITITSGLYDGFRRLERYAQYHRERP